jgi:hypothetical protein|tara:strand:+ start:279 stop:578 length:300 start_codon:yes stop_codon:yes gene_type:complete
MATTYPTIPVLYNLSDEELVEMYTVVRQWADGLVAELDSRDLDQERRGAYRINRAVSFGELGQAQAGDIVYERKTGKFKGYVSVAGTTIGWSDFNSFTP